TSTSCLTTCFLLAASDGVAAQVANTNATATSEAIAHFCIVEFPESSPACVLADGSRRFKTKPRALTPSDDFPHVHGCPTRSAARYPCRIDFKTPTSAAAHRIPVALACTKKPVSRFSAACV